MELIWNLIIRNVYENTCCAPGFVMWESARVRVSSGSFWSNAPNFFPSRSLARSLSFFIAIRCMLHVRSPTVSITITSYRFLSPLSLSLCVFASQARSCIMRAYQSKKTSMNKYVISVNSFVLQVAAVYISLSLFVFRKDTFSFYSFIFSNIIWFIYSVFDFKVGHIIFCHSIDLLWFSTSILGVFIAFISIFISFLNASHTHRDCSANKHTRKYIRFSLNSIVRN